MSKKKHTEDHRKCEGCGNGLAGRREQTKFCSGKCRSRFYKKLGVGTIDTVVKGEKGAIGTISELQASADLIMRGYEVFRALSPHCSCDLAILRQGRLLRVEVRTAQVSVRIDGTMAVYTKPAKPGCADILAMVVRSTGEVFYNPPLE